MRGSALPALVVGTYQVVHPAFSVAMAATQEEHAAQETLLWDCHCHITSPQFEEDREEVIEAAVKAGVGTIIAVSMSPADVPAVLDVAERHPAVVLPCLGLHPVNPATGGSVDEGELQPMLELIEANASRLVGVGEVGLDFTPAVIGKPGPAAEAAKATQRTVLAAQAALALSLGLPLNVHSRGAGHHAITALQQAGCTSNVLLHAFDGKGKYAVAAAEAGMYFSVPPCIVRFPAMVKTFKRLPLSSLVLESDAPALPA